MSSSSLKFEGVYTALVTPFNPDGSIDWESFTKLVESQIAGGVTGIVPVSTTYKKTIVVIHFYLGKFSDISL